MARHRRVKPRCRVNLLLEIEQAEEVEQVEDVEQLEEVEQLGTQVSWYTWVIFGFQIRNPNRNHINL